MLFPFMIIKDRDFFRQNKANFSGSKPLNYVHHAITQPYTI
jgi:hypothetical protein